MSNQILDEREQTHGKFENVAFIAQDIKYALTNNDLWVKIPLTHQESLQMIASKIARIIAGDHNFKDHWDDIAGYALLISRELEK